MDPLYRQRNKRKSELIMYIRHSSQLGDHNCGNKFHWCPGFIELAQVYGGPIIVGQLGSSKQGDCGFLCTIYTAAADSGAEGAAKRARIDQEQSQLSLRQRGVWCVCLQANNYLPVAIHRSGHLVCHDIVYIYMYAGFNLLTRTCQAMYIVGPMNTLI